MIGFASTTRWRIRHAASDALREGSRRLPRFHASRGLALPGDERSGALLHGLPWRHRRAAGSGADGLLRLVRGVPERALVSFDARHNTPRIGRVVMGRGRDAADVALSTAFGQAPLQHFEVTTYEEPVAA